jgi:hypothetical protein
LCVLFPAGVEMGEGDCGLGGIWKGEEGLRGGEHVLYFLEGDAMIDQTYSSVSIEA